MSKKRSHLLSLASFLALATISITVWFLSAEAASSEAIPITSDAPWQEVNGAVDTVGEVVSYTFSAAAGQIATVDLLPAEGSPLEGEVRLHKASDGTEVSDAVYGSADAQFGSGAVGGLTAALPETGIFYIEVDPLDSGDGATGAFVLRFNLIDPGASLLVDDDLNDCPDAPTGFVRAAARAVETNGAIDVCAGVYTSSQVIRLQQPGVTFAGAGTANTIISAQDDTTLQLGAPNLTIKGVALHGGTRRIVEQRYDHEIDGLTVADCRIEGPVTGLELTDAPRRTDDVTVRDCTIQIQSGGTHDRIGVRVYGDRARIYDNVINIDEGTWANSGINIAGDDARITGNVVGDAAWPPNTYVGIYVRGNRALVEQNGVAGYTYGISVNGDAAASFTATIRDNLVSGDTVGVGAKAIYVSQVEKAEVSANLVSGSPDLQHGILANSSGGWFINNRVTISDATALQYSDPEDVLFPVTFANNTVKHGQGAHKARGILISYGGVFTGTLPVTLTNNLLTNPETEPDYHMFCGIDSNRPLQQISHNLIAGYNIPFCNDAALGNGGTYLPLGGAELSGWHLTAASPAIDAGTATGAPPTDFEGDPRPANAAVDIGADELALPVDLSVVKAPTTCGFVGRDLPYEISIMNVGSGTATGVELLDSLPTEATPESVTTSQGSCVLGSATSCTLGSLAPGEKVTVTLTVKPTAVAALTNEVTITAAESDSEAANNKDAVTTQIVDAPAASVDLAPTALEVNQAIQNLANDVPIVEQKPTTVRLYIQSDGSQVENVSALLYGWRDGAPLPGSPLSPLDPFRCMAVDADGPDRADLQQTHLFDLPPEWRTGQVTLTAVVNPGSPGPILETNYDNNEITEVVTFRQQPPICIRTYRVSALDLDGLERLVPTAYLSADEDGLIPRALSLLPTPEMRIFPESAIIARWAPFETDQGSTAPYKKMSGLVQWQILETLWEKDQLSNDPAECDAVDARTHYLGMVHPAATETNPDGFWGRATGINVEGQIVIGDQLVVGMHTDERDASYETPLGGQTIAHELGHNYGRPHPPCDNEGIPRDKNYPYDDCTLGPAEPDAFYGLDMIGESAPVVITPTEAGDLMSYAHPNWISDYQWRKIGLRLCSQQDSLCIWSTTAAETEAADREEGIAPLQPNQTITETESVLMLSGVITDSAQFGSIHRLATDHLPQEKLVTLWDAQLPLTATTEYELNVLDESGGLLYTQPFTPLISTNHQSEALTFGLLIPDQADMATIQLSYQGNGLISRPVSANVPTVTILAPSGGETFTETIPVDWQGIDLDGDDLTYVVQYSADMGQSWRVLQADVTTTTLTINAQTLPGSLDNSLIRVIVNDGVNSGSAQSNPFSLAKRAPLVAIQNPEADAVFDTGLPITLIGSAFDPENGWLADEALTWSVERLGVMGNGREIRLPGLAAGSYQITLEAVDKDGQATVDTITIHVSSSAGTPSATDVYLPMIIR
ncbi:MAG: choice-of-anchor Q domain-containing protein [Candidatus Promineifilaceae bacterium]|nr:choice-of-anchor Q domain-containing protein [Candidatus Promineifilaceae bacterium]